MSAIYPGDPLLMLAAVLLLSAKDDAAFRETKLFEAICSGLSLDVDYVRRTMRDTHKSNG